MATCVAFTYTVHKCSSVAVAEKTSQGLNLLTHSFEVGVTSWGRGCLWNQTQLASAAWFSWSALTGRGRGSPFQRAESWLDRHLHECLVLFTEGRRTRLGAVCLLLEKNFSPLWKSEMQNSPSCCGHHLELDMIRLWNSQLVCGAPGMLCFKQLLFRIWQLLLDCPLTNIP